MKPKVYGTQQNKNALKLQEKYIIYQHFRRNVKILLGMQIFILFLFDETALWIHSFRNTVTLIVRWGKLWVKRTHILSANTACEIEAKTASDLTINKTTVAVLESSMKNSIFCSGIIIEETVISVWNTLQYAHKAQHSQGKRDKDTLLLWFILEGQNFR